MFGDMRFVSIRPLYSLPTTDELRNVQCDVVLVEFYWLVSTYERKVDSGRKDRQELTGCRVD